MARKETIEKGISSLSLNKTLEELVIVSREEKKKNQREDGLKAEEMNQAWFSGTAYTSACWPVCIEAGEHPGFPAAK